MEFIIGATAAGVAVIFTNPLEVVKTRYQLQGELQSKGQYKVHYKSIFGTFLSIYRNDGPLGLQKGLAPAILHQLVFNGCRFGLYQLMEDKRLIHKKNSNDISFIKSLIGGTVGGGFSGFLSSPFYLIKTHLQSKANANIAVGHQHETTGIIQGFATIYKQHGITQLWRGATGAMIRISVGSATQFSSFLICKEYFIRTKIFTPEQKVLNSFVSGMVGGVVIALVMSPFDLISTRLYNQGVDEKGCGLQYKNYFDCAIKTLQSEGLQGFYKGVLPCYLRIGPHSVLCLVFWDKLKDSYNTYFL